MVQKEVGFKSEIDGAIRLSVHLITYNHESFIRQSIDSVLAQKVDFRYEIVIGDDFSTDQTRSIILEYAAKYPDLIKPHLHSSNLGPKGLPGKNNFISIFFSCKGKYIALLDGDDYWADPNKLQRQVDFLDANPDYVLTFHDAKMVDEAGNIITPSMLPESEKRDFSIEEGRRVKWMPTLTTCFRNVLKDFPLEFFQVINGDTVMFSMLAAYGKGGYMKEIEPAVYRIHHRGVWSARNEGIQEITHIETYLKMSAYYKRTGDPVLEEHFQKVAEGGLERMLAGAYAGKDTRIFRKAYFKYLFLGKAYASFKKFLYLQKVMVKFILKR